MNGAETTFLRRILLRFGNGTRRLFRNNVGTAWIGDAVRLSKTQTLTLNAGTVIIRNARIFHGGLCKGSSDIIGFESVQVTPEMVGTRIARFVAIEGKMKGRKPTPEQTAFIKIVNDFGGVAFVAYSEEEADRLINAKHE